MTRLETTYGRQAFKMIGGYLIWWETTLKKEKGKHSKDTYVRITKQQEETLLDDYVVYESGRITEQDTQLDIKEENLASFRSRLRDIERGAGRRMANKGYKE